MINPIQLYKNKNKPLILAHRGLVTEFQENTLSAVKAAERSKYCDGCEVDVFMTKDKKIVLFHDEDIKRLTGEVGKISEMTWQDLKSLTIQKALDVDGGSYTYPKEETIPLLSDVLEEVKDKDFILNIELKAYVPKWSRRETGTEVAKVIRSLGVENQVVCTSFDFFMLHALEKEHHDIFSGFGYDDDMPLSRNIVNWAMEKSLIGGFVNSNCSIVEHTLIDDDSITKYARKEMPVGSYTLFPLAGSVESQHSISHKHEVKRLYDLGIDWLETDHPNKVYDIIYAENNL
jgi:glycerophosphoryl diester phosphodiesterase